MKKLFTVITLTLIFVLIGCETEETKTTLTIRNEFGKTLRNAKWQSFNFTEDKSDGQHITTYYINAGSKATKEVTAGSGYIYFEITEKNLRTQELVVVDTGNDSVFTFTDNTVVVETTNPSNLGPLSGF
ncbi:hypothetical protein [Treponema sp. R8-4-B8]